VTHITVAGSIDSRSEGLSLNYMSVNVSVRQMRDANYLATLNYVGQAAPRFKATCSAVPWKRQTFQDSHGDCAR
jgi:hypothetical protein